MQKVYVVGLGPGGVEQMTARAKNTLKKCDVIAGYHVYIDLIKNDFPGKEFLTTGMRKEVDRCRLAVEERQNRSHDFQRRRRCLRHGRHYVPGSGRASGTGY